MNINQNINAVRELITQTEISTNRKPGSVVLLAVSKQQGADKIQQAFELGITDFAENYYQEGLVKIQQLNALPIFWHFIGPIQSNKTKGIASHFDWVHSVNRIKIAELLNEYRPVDLGPLNVCLQINVVEEETKSGISIAQAAELALAVSQLPNLKLRGLMTIPPPQRNPQDHYHLLLQLNHLMQSINKEVRLNMDTLSMGMSDDLVPAIKAGSTMVRIGRAIFGDRQGKST